MQPISRFSPSRPMQSWLQEMQSRSSSTRPSRALRAVSGSAICCRTIPTRSQIPSASACSAWAGSLIRPTPTTGRSVTSRSAAAVYSW